MEHITKKVGIFTLYHENTNYGATLQAYALQRKVSELGFDARVVDFVPPYGDLWRLPLQKRIIRLILHPSRALRAAHARLKKLFRRGNEKLLARDAETAFEWERLWDGKYAGWREFCKRNVRATKPFPERALPSRQKEYDILLVGSDQVWNPGINTDAFFLPYEKEGRRKIAYAASIARPRLTRAQKRPFRRWLPDFDAVTVREREGKALLGSFLDVPVRTVLDPTFLLTAREWEELSEPVEVRNQVSYRESDCPRASHEANYIFFMALGRDPSIREFASRVARMLKLRVVILSTYLSEMEANRCLDGEEMVDVTPGQFLTLVRRASLVITDSFHCMAFSINFHRNFVVLRRPMKERSENMDSRFYSLLGMLGLEGQIVNPSDAPSVTIRDDLYDGVDEKLERLRERSEKVLGRMLLSDG